MRSTYEYNSQGWLISSTSPDQTGTTSYRYRKDGQIRFSQNPLQLSKGECSYTNYDQIGRPIESGVYVLSGQNFSTINTDTYTPPASNCKERSFTKYGTADSQLPNINGLSQQFILGKVSKTWNDETTTWYSYSYDGNVAWVIQKINGLSGKTFSIEYDYDFQWKCNICDLPKGPK